MKKERIALVLFALALNFNKNVFPRFALKISKIKQLWPKNAVPCQVYGNKNLNKHKHSIFYLKIFFNKNYNKERILQSEFFRLYQMNLFKVIV